MLLYTHNQLSAKKLTKLKAIAKGYNLKGFSTLKKADLVKFIKSNEPSAFDCTIQYVYNESLQSFSITHLDLNLSISSLVSILRQHAAGRVFSNQTHNEKEIKALYRAGFRVRGNETFTEAQTLELLKNSSSIRMVANTTKYNLITEATEEAQEQQTEEIETVSPAEEMQPVEAKQEGTEEQQAENIFWYAYTLRGFSPGCQPSNFIAHNENIGKHGIIGYSRQLTEQELSDYELITHYEPYQKGEEQTDTTQQETGYKAYNRLFPSYDEAYNYCLSCDFDPDYIETVELSTVSPLKGSTCGNIIKACDISYIKDNQTIVRTFMIIDSLSNFLQSQNITEYNISSIYYVNKEGFDRNNPDNSIVYIESGDRVLSLEEDIKIKVTSILTTNFITYSAYEPETTHHTISRFNDVIYGKVGTLDISDEINSLPFGSYERIEAVKKHYGYEHTRAYKAIFNAYPELLQMEYTCSMGEIEIKSA